MTVLGAILAGGEARRFGSDKGVATLGGRTLIEHAADRLRAHVASIVVCGRVSAPAGLATTPDWPRAGLGPLGGLCGALRFAAQKGHSAMLTIGCDTPDMPDALIDRLIGHGAACYVREMPVMGHWPVEHADLLSAHLDADEGRSVRGWGKMIGALALDHGADIANINRPEDLDRFRRSR